MIKPEDWSWKPKDKDIPEFKPKKKKKQGRGKERRQKITKSDNREFYTSKDWLRLRRRILEKYECKCMCCGSSPKLHGARVQVTHIKNRAKYPKLAFHFENLQLMCDDCSGGGRQYETDYRPELMTDDQANEILDDQLLQTFT